MKRPVTYPRPQLQEPEVGPGGARTGVRVIAAFKLLKGMILFAIGVGALKLLHKDLDVVVGHWIDVFRVDPNNHFLRHLLEKFSILDSRKLKQLSAGTFFYAALLLTEGVGLVLGKRWAKYFTIFVTSSFIPLEVYELFKGVNASRVIVLLINVAVVAYLVIDLRRDHKSP